MMKLSENNQITPNFQANKLLAVNKSNSQHNEIKTRMVIAQKSNALCLNQMNIDVIMPDVSSSLSRYLWAMPVQIFKMRNLIRLDLGFNNIVKLNPLIGQLSNLQQLWLNDNPLRELPLEISECHKLKVGPRSH